MNVSVCTVDIHLPLLGIGFVVNDLIVQSICRFFLTHISALFLNNVKQKKVIKKELVITLIELSKLQSLSFKYKATGTRARNYMCSKMQVQVKMRTQAQKSTRIRIGTCTCTRTRTRTRTHNHMQTHKRAHAHAHANGIKSLTAPGFVRSAVNSSVRP